MFLAGSVRRMATSLAARAAYIARTTRVPSQPIRVPPGFKLRSVLIFATPQNLSMSIEAAISLHESEKLQVVLAGVERVVPHGASNGISELWMDDVMRIELPFLLSERDKREPPRVSDGVNPVGAKVNWKQVDASLDLHVQGTHVHMLLANTVFWTSLPSTLFFFESGSAHSGQTLCRLLVTLPPLVPEPKGASLRDHWTPLDTDAPLLVTKCIGNLLKGLNGRSAALFLEQNTQLMSMASKDVKVCVKVFGADGVSKRYEVIAGGGGWGAKADLLALLPEAQLSVGDRIKFYMIPPGDMDGTVAEPVRDQIRFECVADATTYGETDVATQTDDNLFGCGSERGFVAAGVNHKIPGDSLSMSF